MSVACQIPQHWRGTDIATVLIWHGEFINIDMVADVGYECSTHAQHQPSMKSGSAIVFWVGGFSKRGGGEQATLLCCG